MAYVRSLEGFTPPKRYDELPFTQAVIQEAADDDGPWVDVETITLDPADSDPSDPASRNLTTNDAALDPAWYRLLWKDAAGSQFPSDAVYFDGTQASAPSVYYATPAMLRDELGLDSTVLPDGEASGTISDAEDMIDDQLGVRSVDTETGRKVVFDLTDEWRWEKLERATVKLAAFLHRHPEWGAEQRYSAPGGDVGAAGPYGSPWPQVSSLLNDSGLRELTTGVGGARRESVIGNLPEPD